MASVFYPNGTTIYTRAVQGADVTEMIFTAGPGLVFFLTGSTYYTSSISTSFASTASLAYTSSLSFTAISASYSVSSSYALSASYIPPNLYQTGSLFGTSSNSVSASYAATSSNSISASYLSSSFPSITTGYQLGSDFTVIQPASYTLSNADDGRLVIVSGSSTVTISLLSSVSPTFNAMYYQSGSGKILFLPTSTEVLRNRNGQSGSAGQYGLVTLIRVPNGDFILGGDTA